MTLRNLRNKLKNTKKPESSIDDFQPRPVWYTGDDVPIFWSAGDIRRLRRETLRKNYKNGYLSVEQYKKLVKGLRK